VKALLLIWLRGALALGAAALMIAAVQQAYGDDAKLAAGQYVVKASRGI
jgi:hypothetical protein